MCQSIEGVRLSKFHRNLSINSLLAHTHRGQKLHSTNIQVKESQSIYRKLPMTRLIFQINYVPFTPRFEVITELKSFLNKFLNKKSL